MSKEIYIDFIVSQLEKGIISYTNVFEVFLSKFKVSEPTFAKYWKLANEAYKERRSLINEAKLNETIQIEKEAVKSDILSKEEAMAILTEIAKGGAKDVGDKTIIPNPADRKSAIEVLAKLNGWEAPKKTENINTTIEIIRKNADSIE
jgi:hypothetical protein